MNVSKRFSKRLIISVILLFLVISLLPDSIPVFAEDKNPKKIDFNLSVRERLEIWDGMNAKNYGDDRPGAIGSLHDRMLLQRVIAGFVLHLNSKIDFTAHLQDSRAFGWSLRNSRYPDLFKVKAKNTEGPYYILNPNEEFFEIRELYIEFKRLWKNFSFKIGRQKISYGDTRVFGPGDWGNTGRWTWDALKVSYKKGNDFVDAFVGGTKVNDPEKISIPFTKTEFWGAGLYAHYELKKVGAIEPFYAFKTEGSADYARTLNLKHHWVGVRAFNNNWHHLVYDITYAQEFGQDSGKKIEAFGLVVKLGYQLNSWWSRPILAFRESYASGGKNTDPTVKTFDPIYGSKDSYFGRMNIMSWSNLDDREILITFFPAKKLWVESAYHWFYIPQPEGVSLLRNLKLNPGAHRLGNEFVVFANYQLSKRWQVATAFGYFWPGEVQPIDNHPAKNASWLALQLLFEL
ncbi:MAG TPA: hypothetical protein ENO29_04985 [Candidatus Aminicenantes bacterium]|nr:MAG: hypothetical protein C0168_06900 [Candidatus Aminicenantes bacterium]HEK85690.1 hypothetical protein [Candidatus Aminicenantes bacterium]